MRNIIYTLLVFTLFAASGCREKRDYIVSVNGHLLTREMLDRKVAMMEKVFMKANPDASVKKVREQVGKFRKSYRKLFETDCLFSDYLAAEGVQIPAETVQKFRQLAIRSFKKSGIRTWDDMMSFLGDQAVDFDEQVMVEVRRSCARDHAVSLCPTNLTPAQIEFEFKRIADFNKRADITNAVAHAHATNAWNRLKAGESFETVASEMSELKYERKDKGKWANLDWQQMECDPPLLKYARQLKPGEFSPPIEADNGLMILRVDKKDEKECHMSRIFFYLPMYCKVPTAEELEARIKMKHADRVFKGVYDRLRTAAEIKVGDQAKAKNKAKSKDKAKPKMPKLKPKAKKKAAA